MYDARSRTWVHLNSKPTLCQNHHLYFISSIGLPIARRLGSSQPNIIHQNVRSLAITVRSTPCNFIGLNEEVINLDLPIKYTYESICPAASQHFRIIVYTVEIVGTVEVCIQHGVVLSPRWSTRVSTGDELEGCIDRSRNALPSSLGVECLPK